MLSRLPTAMLRAASRPLAARSPHATARLLGGGAGDGGHAGAEQVTVEMRGRVALVRLNQPKAKHIE